MKSTADTSFQQRLDDAVSASNGVRALAAYPVNEAMIATWADALLDDDPVYVDAEAAAATGRTGIIAPPTMIQAWSMPKLSMIAGSMRSVPGYAPYWRAATAAQSEDEGLSTAFSLLRDAGFANSLATNCRQVYHRELVPGDHVTTITSLDSISPQKQTAAGVGHFVTTRMEYVDQSGAAVASQLWTVLQWRPSTDEEKDAAPAQSTRPATPRGEGPPTPGAESDLVGAPRVGQRAVTRSIPITPTFVIATAIATRDFYAIHHDTDWTRSIGQPDIFTNILTTTGLVGGVFTRWAGPVASLRSVDLRLLTPNYPGDTLTLSGTVTSVEDDAVAMSVVGQNEKGIHVVGTVTGCVA